MTPWSLIERLGAVILVFADVRRSSWRGLAWLKNKAPNNAESCRDEGLVGPILGDGLKRHGIDPFETYLPGVHPNGEIDVAW